MTRVATAAVFIALCLTTPRAQDPGPSLPPVSAAERAELAAQVRAEFLHAWSGYRRLAWGHDELKPVSGTAHDWYPPAVVYMTPVDSLDTMLLMGLKDEAADAQAVILEHLSFDQDVSVQVFEVTIRLLGGLLTSYQMTHEPRFLALAEGLGRRLLPAFGSATGMPYRFVNLRTGEKRGRESNPAEIGTLILEFGTLSRLTGKPVYFDTAKRAIVELASRASKVTGLVGEGIDVETGAWTNPKSHIGGAIDSYYEYLLKCARLFGDGDCAAIGRAGLEAVNRYLADEGPGGLWYGEADMTTGRRTATVYGALQAFLPTVFVLAGDVPRAAVLQESNFRMWTLAGIEPEELDYRDMRIVSPGYALRPENAESAYYLYRATGSDRYLAMGRQMLRDLVAYTRVENGYTTLSDVRTKAKGDRMHSFLLAETFKYLYLLFAPADTLDFTRVTFNTEAHPIWPTWQPAVSGARR
jgi:mannosidase alpha-like ER degradation enhancer 2